MNSGIKEVVVASTIQKSAAAAAEFVIKEVMLVKHLDFADWPFPESAGYQILKSPKYDFEGWALLKPFLPNIKISNIKSDCSAYKYQYVIAEVFPKKATEKL